MNSNLSHCRDRLEKEIVDAAASTISFYILLAKFLLHVEARTGLGGKLVVAVDSGVKGRKLKMKMTENDFDQMTGILHCKSGKAFQNSCE